MLKSGSIRLNKTILDRWFFGKQVHMIDFKGLVN